MKLPYKEKIRQICNNKQAFYRYKRDQREVLDYSIYKNADYIKQKTEEVENSQVLLRLQYLGDKSLSQKE